MFSLRFLDKGSTDYEKVYNIGKCRSSDSFCYATPLDIFASWTYRSSSTHYTSGWFRIVVAVPSSRTCEQPRGSYKKIDERISVLRPTVCGLTWSTLVPSAHAQTITPSSPRQCCGCGSQPQVKNNRKTASMQHAVVWNDRQSLTLYSFKWAWNQ